MKVLRKLLNDTDGQGLVEYTLIVFLVAFVFWVAIKDTTAGSAMGDVWSKVSDCVVAPFSCGSGYSGPVVHLENIAFIPSPSTDLTNDPVLRSHPAAALHQNRRLIFRR
jgi:Flp pilus assembly pilin Flp